MSKTILKLLIGFFFPIVTFSQTRKIPCQKIKDGTFYFRPQGFQELIVIRQDSIQIEINTQKKDTSFWNVQWQNRCSYTLKFIRKSSSLSNEERTFYMSHISFVKILTIQKDFYVFKGALDSMNDKSALTDTLWFKPK